MTIPQAAILDDFAPALPGMLATLDSARMVSRRSLTVEAVFGDVAFMVAADPAGFTHTVAAGDEIGIVQFSHAQPTVGVAVTGDVAVTNPVNVVKQGVIWVTTTENVTDITVPVTYAVGGKIGVGQANPLPSARFLTLASATEVVQIEINLP